MDSHDNKEDDKNNGIWPIYVVDGTQSGKVVRNMQSFFIYLSNI